MSKYNVLSVAVFIIALLYYFITPITFDVFVFLGSAHLAEIQYGGGIWGAIQSWELKPFANRIIIYILYKISSLFVDFEEKKEFIAAIKIVFSLFILLAGYCLTIIIRRIKQLKLISINYFLLSSSVLLLHSFRTILQSEYLSLLFSLYGLYFITSPKKVNYLIAVFILSLLPFFKGISFTFIIQILAVLYGFFDWKIKQILKSGMMIAASSIVIAVIIFSIYPQEFLDLRDAASFQSSFNIPFKEFLTLVFIDSIRATLIYTAHYPLIPIAFLSTLLALLLIKRHPDLSRTVVALLTAWSAGYLAIIVQHKFWAYHFVNFSLPVIFSILIIIRLSKEYKLFRKTAILLVCTGYLLFFSFTSPTQYFIPERNFYSEYKWGWDYISGREELKSWEKIIAARPKLDNNDSILYLSDGAGVWFWGGKSASRYFLPLPFQRVTNNLDLFSRKCFNDFSIDIKNFKGKYVLWDKTWFNVPDSLTTFLNNYSKKELLLNQQHHYILCEKRH